MVYAYKNYKSSQQYVKKSNSGTLDNLIKKISGEASAPYKTNPIKKKKSFLDKSVQNLAVNSIIEGGFPKENVVRQMAIKRVNKMLCVILGTLIMLVIVSYYFVISCEIKLNDLSRQTVVLNNENAELQNKLDSLKSFNNVDKTLQQNNMLQKAGRVIETQAVEVESNEITAKTKKKRLFNYAIGF